MKLKISLKARAIRYLSIREYSTKELTQKLAPFVGDGDDLGALLEWLRSHGFLSDMRFVDAYVRRRSVRYGSRRILQELQGYGISDTVLHQVGSEMRENELERARQIWQKKFGNKPSDVKERARQIRFLQQRGFPADIIRRVMRDEILLD